MKNIDDFFRSISSATEEEITQLIENWGVDFRCQKEIDYQILSGAISLSLNRFHEARQIFEQSQTTSISRSAYLVATILDDSSSREAVINAITSCLNRRTEVAPSYLDDLSLSLGYRALGYIEEALEFLPAEITYPDKAQDLNSFVIWHAGNLKDLHVELLHSLAIHDIDQGQNPRALQFLTDALDISPKDVGLYSTLASYLLKIGEYQEAKLVLDTAINIEPTNAALHSLSAKAMQYLQYPEFEIFLRHLKSFELQPQIAEHLINACTALIRCGDWQRLLEVTSHISIHDETEDYTLIVYRAVAAANLFEYPILCNEEEYFATLAASGDGIADPFVCLWFDLHAKSQYERAVSYSKQKFPVTESVSLSKSKSVTKRKTTKIGIFSGDFCNHAGMTLMLDIFKSFDKTRFEIFAFDVGTLKQDNVTDCVKAWATDFFACAHWSAKEIKERCYSLQLDVAIDRGGHTGTNRLDLFASRLAPVQISYLAYPSTTGAAFIDYIVGDRIVIPEENRQFFTEHVIELPMCYQPNSRNLFPSATGTKRPKELPSDAFVLSCFNAIHKLRTIDLRQWVSILKRHSNTVLWLITDNEFARTNIKLFIEQAGVAPERVIFSKKVAWNAHQARIGFSDLCLDSHIYGSHTTATDCLVNNVPIVTMAGDGFQTRVCASILIHLGLEELVVESWQDYQSLVSELILDPARLNKIKYSIASKMDTHQLAKRSAEYLSAFFRAIDRVVERHDKGLQPEFTRIQLS